MSFVGEEPTPGIGLFGPSVDAFDQRAEQLGHFASTIR